MTPSNARSIVLPVFSFIEICDRSDPGAISAELKCLGGSRRVSFFWRASGSRQAAPSTPASFNKIPIVLKRNGAPCEEMTLFLMSRLELVAHASQLGTLRNIADDLAAYLRFCDEEKLDFRSFPRNRLFRPTYRYRATLRLEIEAGRGSVSTARRRLGSVIAFYRWALEERIFAVENPPWIEREATASFVNEYGSRRTKRVRSTDLILPHKPGSASWDEVIQDGGKLRPLELHEQNAIWDVLLELGNTQMTLMHLIGWLVGARIQTILTLTVRQVVHSKPGSSEEVAVPVGRGTLVDTKGRKPLVLFFPRVLLERLHAYALSSRARELRLRAGSDSIDQYLFLSNRGEPYYRSSAERSTFDSSNGTRHEKEGRAIRAFIRDRVLPAARLRLGTEFTYRLHDLRATFGMNLTDHQLALVAAGRATLHEVREFVKARMGHESAATTDLYLNYRQRLRLAANVQVAYESHLSNMIARVNSVQV